MRTFAETLADSLGTLTIEARDNALVRLAVAYAAELDAGADLKEIGPKYQACLTALGLTRTAGTAKGGEVHGIGVVSPLQRFRDDARARRGAPVHPSAS